LAASLGLPMSFLSLKLFLEISVWFQLPKGGFAPGLLSYHLLSPFL
jgi:hypothetical protein